MTLNRSLIFLLAAFGLNLILAGGHGYLPAAARSSGGPVISLANQGGLVYGSLVYPAGSLENDLVGSESLALAEDGLMVGQASPLSNASLNRDGLMTYKVLAGDTLSGIAAKFGISIETLKLANPGLKNSISPGKQLVILPVSGLLYQPREGDSIESVLARYQVGFELFQKYNPRYQEALAKNKILILPFASPVKDLASVSRYSQDLPDLRSYFALPARGWNWGELHDFNAVDIADDCGQPIYASAEGLVIEESGSNRWNNGYGNQVLIEHPNGTKTRYAHTLKNQVTVGDYVAQGDQISFIGNTGNVQGAPGCHLHFEVYGAKNPFAIR